MYTHGYIYVCICIHTSMFIWKQRACREGQKNNIRCISIFLPPPAVALICLYMCIYIYVYVCVVYHTSKPEPWNHMSNAQNCFYKPALQERLYVSHGAHFWQALYIRRHNYTYQPPKKHPGSCNPYILPFKGALTMAHITGADPTQQEPTQTNKA